MMGRLKSEQAQLFYQFRLDDAVPEDHLVRKIDAALDLSWLRSELAPHYSSMGRPSIDPELMIRMLIVGYVFAIRSERLICREVQVNLAYRWFCSSASRTLSPITQRSRGPATSASEVRLALRSRGAVDRGSQGTGILRLLQQLSNRREVWRHR
jgi:hypothetical protein